jgi:hypothetical protein
VSAACYSVRIPAGYVDDVCLGDDAPSLAVIKRRPEKSHARWTRDEAEAMRDLLCGLRLGDAEIVIRVRPESSYADEGDEPPFSVSSGHRPKNCRFFGQPVHAM